MRRFAGSLQQNHPARRVGGETRDEWGEYRHPNLICIDRRRDHKTSERQAKCSGQPKEQDRQDPDSVRPIDQVDPGTNFKVLEIPPVD